ncbi:MAG: ABC transporter ATP-binding protein [Planctomycetota bacterium]
MTTASLQPDPETSKPLAELRAVCFAYGRGPEVVCDLSLKLSAGRVHCLLGDSGCGKSTLLRLLAGLERPSRGSILIGDEVVSSADLGTRHRKPEHRAVGYVFQDYALFPHLSVVRNVMFGMRGKPRAERKSAAAELLDRVGLADFANTMPHTLSGGQQQRVALARALGRDPKLMLLDEPFTSLDTTLRDELRGVTLRVLREAGVATLMVTHDPAEALLVADTVSVMRAGRFVLEGLPDEVCTLEPRDKGPAVVRLKIDADA